MIRMGSIPIILLLCSTVARAQSDYAIGVQSNLMMQMDSSMSSGGIMGSTSKLNIQYSRQFDFLNSYITANTGGVLFQNNVQSDFDIIPEWDIESGLNTGLPFSLRFFSKYKPFSPYQYFNNRFLNIESETGVEVNYHLNKSNTLTYMHGVRHLDLIGESVNNNFNSIQFQRHSANSLFRFSGDFVEINQNPYQKYSLQHWLRVGKGRISLSAMAHDQTEYQYTNMSFFGHLPFHEKHKINFNYVLNDYTVQGDHQFKQFYQFQYRFYPKHFFNLETKVESDWVRKHNNNLSLWRSYLSGIGLNVHKNNFKINNGTYLGYREDFHYGKGFVLDQEARFVFFPKKISIAEFQVNDFVRGMYFYSATEEGNESLYEWDNELKMGVKFWPNRSIYPGFRSVLNTHIGDDLTYRPDSLENTLLNTLYLTYREITNWVEIGFSMKEKINHSELNENIYSVNYRLKLPMNSRVSGVVRFNTDEYLTVRTSYRFYLGDNQFQVDLNHVGKQSDLWRDKTQVMIGFRRDI